jgi:hypothetical protein
MVDACFKTPIVKLRNGRAVEDQGGSRCRWRFIRFGGIKGGLAGSHAALAMLYGLLSRNGIWYPINLLAAGFFPAAMTQTTAEIAAFHLNALLIAVPIHLITSLLVGLLYGATLPMLPRRPILVGGLSGDRVVRSHSHSWNRQSGA